MKRVFRWITNFIDHSLLLIILILLLGAVLRFYKLDWGQHLLAHPDEYHIVISVLQLKFPTQMNPHFFSYGTVVIYLIYFTNELLKFLSPLVPSLFSLPFNLLPFLIGRFYSALFSTLTILIWFQIAKLVFKKPWTYLLVFLVAITPGLIQQAHFATPESALIFFLSGCLLFSLRFTNSEQLRDLVLSSAFLGLGLGVKVSALPFLLVIISAVTFKLHRSPKKMLIAGAASIASLLVSLTAGAPFIFLDFPAFRGNIIYEGSLAAGQIPVFYTRQFINTIPVLFQIEKILPFALGVPLTLLGLVGFFIYLSSLIKKPEIKLSIILLAFLVIFVPTAFLFAKWTRFVALTFPFWAFFAVFLLAKFYRDSPRLTTLLAAILVITTTIWSVMFFSIYLRDDVRITASGWLENHLPAGAAVLVEGGNTVDLPPDGSRHRISLDFYNLEQNKLNQEQVAKAMEQSDYFLVESRRVFANHQRLPNLFPVTARFYQHLFSGDFGFKETASFVAFPTLSLPGVDFSVNDEEAEETWSVFDHPVIRVFVKTDRKTSADYLRIWQSF